MRALVAEIAAGPLATAVGADWHIYPHAVPSTPAYPYLWVYSNAGSADTDDFTDAQARRDVTVWVVAVAASGSAPQAAIQAAWGAEKAQVALVGWRSTLGAQSWPATSLSSQPPGRDDDLPDRVVYTAVDTYGVTIQP